MPFPTLFLGLLLALPAMGVEPSGDEGEVAPSDDGAAPRDWLAESPENSLDTAISDYLAGDLEAARITLIRLVGDPRLEDTDLRRRIRIFLGEVQYMMGESQASWNTFLALLLEEPDYHLDEFVHPPEVIAYFESVREFASRFEENIVPIPNPAPPPDAGRPPPGLAVVVLPGGLQFYNDQRVLGIAVTTGVAAFTATSLGMRFHLVAQDQKPDTPGIDVLSQSEADRLEQIRSWQNSSVWATTGIWTLAVFQGMLRSNRDLANHGMTAMLGPGVVEFEALW